MGPTGGSRFAALAGAGVQLLEEQLAASMATQARMSEDGDQNGATKKQLKNPLVWIDLEMTGLDIAKDTVIEIAVIVTDGDLAVMKEGPALAIHHGDDVLDAMNDWCKEHHGKSGLTQRVRESTVNMAQAEAMVLDFIKQWVPDQNMAQLAGNSIHVDRMFLVRHMPELVNHLNYRVVDVSTVKELARRWCYDLYRKAPRKASAHTALADIRESIDELKYYRRVLFVKQAQPGASSGNGGNRGSSSGRRGR